MRNSLLCCFVISFFLKVPLAPQTQSLGEAARQIRSAKAQIEISKNEADSYFDEIQRLLQSEKFDQIDRLAASDRSTKTRFAGGGWKLRTLYIALSEFPKDVKPANAEWTSRIDLLKRWIEQRPKSITPRVALADTYSNYAWEARGAAYADKVTDEGWQLFVERIQLSKDTLDNAATLQEKCPQWYNAMQGVALGQAWSKERAEKLFGEAISFEPSYYYYYNQYTNYLLPKWYGKEGEAEQFADAISSHIGGKAGSIIYFEIAAKLGCNCGNESLLPNMSWEKIQQGYAALEEAYGTSSPVLNKFAYMAVKMRDAETAQKLLQRVGDDWDKETWRTRKYFDQCKAWASYAVEMSQRMKSAESLVEANMQTTAGRQYDGQIAKEFAEKFTDVMQQCVQSAGDDLASFDFFVEVNPSGRIQQVLPSRATAVSHCLLPRLYSTTFAAPPKPEYWVKIQMNIGQ